MKEMETKINNILLYWDKRLFTKKKYIMGLFRDIGNYLRIYPILLRSGSIIATIYWICSEKMDGVIVIAKLIVIAIIYILMRFLIPRRIYEIE